MSLTPEDEEIAAYWSHASTARGRLAIRLRLACKHLGWRIVIGGSSLLKRLLDLLGSSAALVMFCPLFLLVALLIRKEDGGPVFFGQPRVGYRGRLFRMWKFRSMTPNADALKEQLLAANEMQGGVTFKMKNDPRVTRIGRFIRRYSIDELPQFWNVFHGEMSLVGPRPPVPKEVAGYDVESRQRLMAKPGLTCFWQVGGRSTIDFAGQVRLDLAYIRSESLWLDLTLLLKTVPAVLLGRGAY
jgi:lipopolysaccharide/colanic/teichoic acid biosynthesis glycosyltransferase